MNKNLRVGKRTKLITGIVIGAVIIFSGALFGLAKFGVIKTGILADSFGTRVTVTVKNPGGDVLPNIPVSIDSASANIGMGNTGQYGQVDFSTNITANTNYRVYTRIPPHGTTDCNASANLITGSAGSNKNVTLITCTGDTTGKVLVNLRVHRSDNAAPDMTEVILYRKSASSESLGSEIDKKTTIFGDTLTFAVERNYWYDFSSLNQQCSGSLKNIQINSSTPNSIEKNLELHCNLVRNDFWSVTGKIINGDGPAGVSGATISTKGKSAISGQDGNYAISDIPVPKNAEGNADLEALKNQVITVTKSGYATRENKLFEIFPEQEFLYFGGDPHTPGLAIHSPQSYSPHIFSTTTPANFFSVTGNIVSLETGTPLKDVSVTTEGITRLSDSNGNYTIANIPTANASAISFSFSKSKYTTLRRSAMQLIGTSTPQASRSYNAQPVQLTFAPFSISGKVVDFGSGNPLEKVKISTTGNSTVVHDVYTDGDGSFVIEGLSTYRSEQISFTFLAPEPDPFAWDTSKYDEKTFTATGLRGYPGPFDPGTNYVAEKVIMGKPADIGTMYLFGSVGENGGVNHLDEVAIQVSCPNDCGIGPWDYSTGRSSYFESEASRSVGPFAGNNYIVALQNVLNNADVPYLEVEFSKNGYYYDANKNSINDERSSKIKIEKASFTRMLIPIGDRDRNVYAGKLDVKLTKISQPQSEILSNLQVQLQRARSAVESVSNVTINSAKKVLASVNYEIEKILRGLGLKISSTSISGFVRDSESNLLSGMLVTIGNKNAVTDKKGKYEVTRTPSGNMTIDISNPRINKTYKAQSWDSDGEFWDNPAILFIRDNQKVKNFILSVYIPKWKIYGQVMANNQPLSKGKLIFSDGFSSTTINLDNQGKFAYELKENQYSLTVKDSKNKVRIITNPGRFGNPSKIPLTENIESMIWVK